MKTSNDSTKECILCLSLAPLSYLAGIPKTVNDLYTDNSINTYFASIALSRSELTTKVFNRERIYKPDFRYKTFALSVSYLYDIVFRYQRCSIIHYQHPDPISAIGILIRSATRSKYKLVITWHADIYKSYCILAPILFIIDCLMYCMAEKIIFFTSNHLRSSAINHLPLLKNKAVIIPQGVVVPSNIIQKN